LTSKSYSQALDRVLAPEGFLRNGRDWTRIRDGFRDDVNLQTASHLGITANLLSREVASEQILAEALADGAPYFYTRIGRLIDGNDRWWRDAPNGPAELSEAVRDYGLPYLEQQHSLEEQARRFGRFSPKWGSGVSSRLCCAITLYRMGLPEEACQMLRDPPRRFSAKWLADIEAVRRRLGCET